MTKGLLAKKCTKCGEWKSRGEFSPQSKTRGGLRSDCKACAAVVVRAHRAKMRARTEIEIPSARFCPDCNTEKPAIEFGRRLAARSGLETYCKECRATRDRKRRSEPHGTLREREFAKTRRWRMSDSARKAETKRGAIRELRNQIAVEICMRLGLNLQKLAKEKYDAEFRSST